jgi:general secretion pathway protein D
MQNSSRHVLARCARAALAACALLAQAGATLAQPAECPPGQVKLNIPDQELNVVIDTMSQYTGRNFIYDDRVRGRVTIVSPACVTLEEAYAVFESVLQVKGFTTVAAPGGSIKIIPLREAKETNVETVRGRPPGSDRFITRLIPLRYIDAEAISNTLKPLVSKDASMVAYAPTNTIILTDSGTNIARILDILRDIDVDAYKEELSVVHLKHADATTLAEQLSEIFGAEVSGAAPGAPGLGAASRQRRALQPTPQGVPAVTGGDATPSARARIITDPRTNSLLILSSRQRTAEIREAIARLDVKAEGGGRIHVYRLKHADAEELATTLSQLLGGQSGAPAASSNVAISGGVPGAANLRAAVTELAEGGLVVTPDAPTNSLVIQASVEGFNAISEVIAKLDTPRPQVLVEALIMEVNVSDGTALGFTGLVRVFNGDNSFTIGSLSDGNAQDAGVIGGSAPTGPSVTPQLLQNLLAAAAGSSFVAGGNFELGDTLIQALIRASATATGTNVLSAPHILTLDNEQAEIKVGANIPIITSRVESAQGQNTNLSSSVNVERLDVGITLRVTPQISEGDSLRLKLFQEITGVTTQIEGTGDVSEVGPTLTSRKVENSVIVSDHETVVIGGLIDENSGERVSRVPWLGEIPVLGWLFKSTDDSIRKTNLLIFLTPHIIRSRTDHASESIRKREEFWQSSEEALQLSRREREEADQLAEAAVEKGVPVPDYSGHNPVRTALREHRERYPVERMSELEASSQAEREATALGEAEPSPAAPRYGVHAATFGDEGAAMATLQQLIDAGHDGTLRTEQRSGTVLYEIHLGPFDSAEAAEAEAAAIAQSFGLAPQVTLLREEQP